MQAAGQGWNIGTRAEPRSPGFFNGHAYKLLTTTPEIFTPSFPFLVITDMLVKPCVSFPFSAFHSIHLTAACILLAIADIHLALCFDLVG